MEPTGRPVGVYLCHFCQRDAVFIAVFVIARCVCVSVRPSLSLSQSGVMSKRLNVSAHDGPQHFCKLIAVTKCRLDGSRLKYEVHVGLQRAVIRHVWLLTVRTFHCRRHLLLNCDKSLEKSVLLQTAVCRCVYSFSRYRTFPCNAVLCISAYADLQLQRDVCGSIARIVSDSRTSCILLQARLTQYYTGITCCRKSQFFPMLYKSTYYLLTYLYKTV